MSGALLSVSGLGRLALISPHLDDAVFSCGALIAVAWRPVVITAFAGMPPEPERCTEWDAASGFGSAQQAIAARREEDRQALAGLNAIPCWLDFCDSQYGATPAAGALAAALSEAVRKADADTVLLPAGLFHSDHGLTHRAALLVRRGERQRQWLMYEDALYRRIAGLLQRRLAALLDEGVHATPVAFDTAGRRQAKQGAVRAYASQLRALRSAGRPGCADMEASESYWRLAPAEAD